MYCTVLYFIDCIVCIAIYPMGLIQLQHQCTLIAKNSLKYGMQISNGNEIKSPESSY